MKGGIDMTIFYDDKEKYKQRILCMILCVCITMGSWGLGLETALEEPVMAQESLSMYSGSYALMDGDTGRVLVGKEEETAMANASTTKILTCIVTLENCSLDEVVTISANAANQPKVRYGVKEGENYSLEEMLYGLMLESYNDCAVAIAEHVAGSEEAFSEMLNTKAKDIGCQDTYFITPNGLDAENEGGFHHTTAEDLCRIMAYCVWESPKKDLFLEITQTRSYGSFVNRNAFLDQMEGVLSGKTGFTAKAGYCYVAALEQAGERYTIALLACGWPNNKTYKWHDARQLFSYGMENYEIKEVVLKDMVEEVEIEGYVSRPAFSKLNQNSILELMGKRKTYQLLMAEGEQLKEEYLLYKNIELPIEKGEILGLCNLYIGDVQIDSIPLIATKFCERWNFEKILEAILCQFLTFSA